MDVAIGRQGIEAGCFTKITYERRSFGLILKRAHIFSVNCVMVENT